MRVELDHIQACKDMKHTGCCSMTLVAAATVAFMVTSGNCKWGLLFHPPPVRPQEAEQLVVF